MLCNPECNYRLYFPLEESERFLDQEAEFATGSRYRRYDRRCKYRGGFAGDIILLAEEF